MKTQSIILTSLMFYIFFFIGCNEEKNTSKNSGNEFVPQAITSILIEQEELDGDGQENIANQNLEIKTPEEKQFECGRIDITKNEYITMQVIPEKISINTSYIFKIENHTKGVLNYGTPLSLEYFNGNDWEKFILMLIGHIFYSVSDLVKKMNLSIIYRQKHIIISKKEGIG